MHVQKLADLRQQRSAAQDQIDSLAVKSTLTAEEQKSWNTLVQEIDDADAHIERVKSAQALSAKSAKPVSGQSVPAQAKSDQYDTDKSLVVAGCAKMIGLSGGSVFVARSAAQELYGENHLVTKALITGSGASGGFIVPPDYMNEIIELLRPQTVVRGSNPRTIPMPRGTMTLPGQASAASAGYGPEGGKIANSQPGLNQIVASFKKLTALVPVSNDMMRYADPAVDAFVRDDLVKVIGLAEDYYFMLGDGTNSTPRGFMSFANAFAAANGGSAGTFLSTANSTFASGGQFITSNTSYTLVTVNNELLGAINKLDTANVPDMKRVWIMNPRTKNYLIGLQNSLGAYVYRDEMKDGKLFGYPFKTTTQVPTNIVGPTGTTGLSFIFLTDMTEAMILDSMQLELAVSREGTYIDGGGNTVSAFQLDQTLIRAIEEHDFQVRHQQSVAVIQGVAWTPAST